MFMEIYAMPWIQAGLGNAWNWYTYAGAYIVASIGGGIVLANLIEYPFLRLRDRWFPSRIGLAVGGR